MDKMYFVNSSLLLLLVGPGNNEPYTPMLLGYVHILHNVKHPAIFHTICFVGSVVGQWFWFPAQAELAQVLQQKAEAEAATKAAQDACCL
eukprot:3614360-Amphidinium_carterae.1